MAKRTARATEAVPEDREPLSEAWRAYLDLNRKALEDEAHEWQRVGQDLRSGEYSLESAVKDTQNGAQRMLGYCTDLVGLSIQCVSAFAGSLGSGSESQ